MLFRSKAWFLGGKGIFPQARQQNSIRRPDQPHQKRARPWKKRTLPARSSRPYNRRCPRKVAREGVLGLAICNDHLRQLVHAQGFVYRRPKHTLEGKRNEQAYRAAPLQSGTEPHRAVMEASQGLSNGQRVVPQFRRIHTTHRCRPHSFRPPSRLHDFPGNAHITRRKAERHTRGCLEYRAYAYED